MRPEELSLAGRWTGISAPAVDFWMQKLSPTWSLKECLARVESIDDECEGVKTLTLRTNRNWKGSKPGQHVRVSVQVDGRWLTRQWTISSAPQADLVQLTVARIPNGRVTHWIHDRLHVGDIIKLSAAMGDFVLPASGAPVVFFAGGAGITPALSMLRHMRATGDQRPFELVYSTRSPELVIAAKELQSLQQALPNLRLHLFHTYDDDASRRSLIHQEQVASFQLDQGIESAVWMMCGPDGFMNAVEGIVDALRPGARLSAERFTPPSFAKGGTGGTVRFTRSTGEAPNAADQTLLAAVEASGRNPKFGCRAGICFECTCTKKEGAVVDLRTGELLTEDNQQIQLCVTQAVGDVTLDL